MKTNDRAFLTIIFAYMMADGNVFLFLAITLCLMIVWVGSNIEATKK